MALKNRKRSKAFYAAVCALLFPVIVGVEGTSLVAYQDIGGVWTICHGDTFEVVPHQVVSKEECSERLTERINHFITGVDQLIEPSIGPKHFAAFTSFTYNVGEQGFARSEALRLTNAGQYEAGCKAMLNWYRAGGRDCRDRANNCYGVYARRQEEVKLCLEGVKENAKSHFSFLGF